MFLASLRSPHTKTESVVTLWTALTGGAAKAVSIRSLATELAERSRVPSEHAGRTRDTRGITRLPTSGTLTLLRWLLHWTTVGNEFGDLPVNPVNRRLICGLKLK